MADHVRKQIREAAVAALGGLPTSEDRVFKSRTYDLQENDVPGLRVYTNDESIGTASMGVGRRREHRLTLLVEACSKQSAGMDDELDAMVKQVTARLDVNQGIGGAKWVEPRGVDIDMDGEADKEIGVARMTFEVLYYTAQGAPDVAL